jgi:amino-acid N-acetyltransferase
LLDAIDIVIPNEPDYTGIRKARLSDVESVQKLLQPLEREGVLVKRSRNELEAMMQDFIVIERETKVLGCAMLLPLGKAADGTSVAELGAFCVDPVFR